MNPASPLKATSTIILYLLCTSSRACTYNLGSCGRRRGRGRGSESKREGGGERVREKGRGREREADSVREGGEGERE